MGNSLFPIKVITNVDVTAVIEAAAKSPLGIVALVTIVVGLVGYGLFRASDDRFKLAAFVMLVGGGGMLAAALIHEANRQSERADAERQRVRGEKARASAVQTEPPTPNRATVGQSRFDFLSMDPDPKNLMPGWMVIYPADWFLDETENTTIFKRGANGEPEYGLRIIVEEREVPTSEYLEAVNIRRRAGVTSEQYLNPAMPGNSTWSSEYHEAFVQQQFGHGKAGYATTDYLETPDSRVLGQNYEIIRYDAVDFDESSPDGEVMSAIAFFNDGVTGMEEGFVTAKRKNIYLTTIACKVPTANWSLVQPICNAVLNSLRIYKNATSEQLSRAAGLPSDDN